MNAHSELFLQIARQHRDLLKGCMPPVQIGGRAEDYSDHFRHSLICSVFAAFAVEHAMAELIWVRCWLQTPKPYRAITRMQAASARTIRTKLEILTSATRIDENLLREIRDLFDYRNRIAHATATPFDNETLGFEALEAILEARRGDELDQALEASFRGNSNLLEDLAREFGERRISLGLSGLGTDDVDIAEVNLGIAERAIDAIRGELDREWPPA